MSTIYIKLFYYFLNIFLFFQVFSNIIVCKINVKFFFKVFELKISLLIQQFF